MRVLGIDEAGRGCVLGPLVIAAYTVEATTEASLWEAGVADSKTLTAKRRVAIRADIERLGSATLREITPQQIDLGNLNALEEEAIAELVRSVRPDKVIVDALGHPSSLPATIARLRSAVEPEVYAEWVVEPKADANHAPVAAASIFAKTTRDARLDALRERYGTLGSGYPSDPKTRAWLTTWARTGEAWPDFVRTRWQTVSDIAQQVLLQPAPRGGSRAGDARRRYPPSSLTE